MPRECDYVYLFAEKVRLRMWFRLDGSKVTDFLVQLEAELDDEWTPVVRFDSAHGRPHMDLMNRRGRQIEKRWLAGSFNDALTEATRDVKANWPNYLARFLEEA